MESDRKKDPLSEALGMNPLIKAVESVVTFEEEGDHVADHRLARKNIADAISKGQLALDELFTIAKQSQHPRAFEVLSTLIKTIVDSNKDLVDLHKKKRDLEDGMKQANQGPTTMIQNNVYAGTTASLQKLISDMRSGKIVEITPDVIEDDESNPE